MTKRRTHGDPAGRARSLRPLRDRIQPGVRVLLVGINPGIRSAEIGHHFAGYSNRFWKLLYESGLVTQAITTEEDSRLPEWGIGITNLVARPTAGIGDLRPAEYGAGRRRLLSKIRRFHPAVVALVGVTLYRALVPQGSGRNAAVGREAAAGKEAGRKAAGEGSRLSPAASSVTANPPFGLRPERLAGVDVFVLPNPSGRNANYSYAAMLDAFRALKRHLDSLARGT